MTRKRMSVAAMPSTTTIESVGPAGVWGLLIRSQTQRGRHEIATSGAVELDTWRELDATLDGLDRVLEAFAMPDSRRLPVRRTSLLFPDDVARASSRGSTRKGGTR